MRTVLALLLTLATIHAFAQSNKLVVHEWGTFTSFQDENGRAIPGLNADDEPLPAFVSSIPISNDREVMYAKGIPRLHPQVTMRLETPVVYFYPPADAKLPMKVTFSATFHGGLLTQFFPNAEVSGLSRRPTNVVTIDPKGAGSLTWKDVLVGAQGKMPETNDRVWTAPRETQSAMLAAKDGTGEKFLFYRGVGNLNAPLTVLRDNGKLLVHMAPETEGRTEFRPDPESMYLVQIRADGACAFHRFQGGDNVDLKLTLTAPDHFADADFKSNVNLLRNAMMGSLVHSGLKADEAMAMLNTWELSYFKSPGTRLFFVVPPAWTNATLPITVSEPADITRVMVGRIEIVTPQQREAIASIAKAGNIKDRSVFTAYLGLGRFRDALLLDAAKKTPELEAFLKYEGIQFASVNEQTAAISESAVPRGASPAAK